ncbi:MAG: ATP-binding protein [Anaerolineales bacterium]
MPRLPTAYKQDTIVDIINFDNFYNSYKDLMSNAYLCPNCQHEVLSTQTHCPNCGINPALAAILAESEVAKKMSETDKFHIAPEILVPKIGDYLVERGALKKEYLEKALKTQKELQTTGDYKLLGQILIEKNFIDQATLDTAITEQIIILQDALKKSNSELENRVQERTRELRQALHRITELNQLKTNFISNISHELRTPLAHMIGYLELLNDGSLGTINPEQTHAVGVLLKSYDRLHSLIDELIQFSMLSQGEMTLDLKKISPADVIMDISSRTNTLADNKKVALNFNNQAEGCYVIADPDKFSWVIGELVENGIKFNNPGGTVSLNITKDSGLIHFQIVDSGIGINPNQFSEIFEPFHQLDGSSTRKEGGTGIGLTLAKQIIEAHGATLNVKSAVDKGTSFEFSLTQA